MSVGYQSVKEKTLSRLAQSAFNFSVVKQTKKKQSHNANKYGTNIHTILLELLYS